MLRLHEQVRLRRESYAAVFFRRDKIISGDVHFIHPKLAYLVLARDQGKLDQAADQTGMTEQEIDGHVTSFVQRHPSCYVHGTDISPYIRAQTPEDWLYEPDPLPLVRRLSWPISLNIIVTDECVFKCRYCCITTSSHGQGKVIHGDVYERIISEASGRGSEAVNLHGGEPTLHPELPGLIRIATDHGLHTSFSTKARIDPDYAGELADSGLTSVQVSIDSPDPARERELTGVDLNSLFTTVCSLTGAGVEVSVNTIVNKTTADTLDRLVECCGELGATELGLSVYSYAPRNFEPQFMLSTEEFVRLEQVAAELNSDRLAVSFTTPPVIDRLGPSSGCSSLRTSATIDPDGRLCVCDKMAHDDAYALGTDLNQAWNGPMAQELVMPSRDLFAGTVCEQCDLFDQCLTRGRCVFRSLALHGTVHAPDRTLPPCEPGREQL